VTGTATIELVLNEDGDGQATRLQVDEVALGSSPGGPRKVYLPLVGRASGVP